MTATLLTVYYTDSGNIVEVSYEGSPCYDTYKPVSKAAAYRAPASTYKLAPNYHA